MSMFGQARETCAKYGMLKPGDRVYAGVSGGADSVALLYFLLSIKDELGLDITVLHLNHMLRGAESARDEAFVQSLCESLGVRCEVERADITAISVEKGISLEEAGREARYEFFSRHAGNGSGAKIAVAHTLGDSVETALLNFARGTALRGLCGIPPVRGNIIRPLIECERAQIEEYLKQNGFEHIHDSSNDSDDFSRNRLRHHAIPALSGVNAAFMKNAARALDALRADADYLDGEAARALENIEIENGRFERASYLGYAQPIRLRMLFMLLSRHKIPADYARLSRLDGIIGAGCGAEQLSSSLFLKAHGVFFELAPPSEAEPPFRVTVGIPESQSETGVFPGKKLRLMNTDYEYYEENIKCNPKLLKNSLDCDRIDGILICRQRASGDRIKLDGRGCTKTLKKLLSEAKIPQSERGRLFVLADDSGPVWVEGFGVSERVSAGVKSRKILILDVVTEVEP